jgi:inorganic pyrophosphatase
MNLDHVSIGRNPPEEVNAIIEVPIGGEPIKYEMDKKAGTLVVDRFLYTPMRYPGNYGFIPHTLSEDGDPCDILVANTRPIIPGAVVAVRPIGVLKMTDEGGGDEKIVAVPIPKLTQRYAHVMNYTDLPEITCGRSSTSSRTTRTLKVASGSGLQDGATPMRRNALSPRRSTDLKVRVRSKGDSSVISDHAVDIATSQRGAHFGADALRRLGTPPRRPASKHISRRTACIL